MNVSRVEIVNQVSKHLGDFTKHVPHTPPIARLSPGQLHRNLCVLFIGINNQVIVTILNIRNMALICGKICFENCCSQEFSKIRNLELPES